MVWTVSVSYPGSGKEFSLLQNIQASSEDHPVYRSKYTGVLPRL
jgi:hypothetical protein